jgi:hypothetical protein
MLGLSEGRTMRNYIAGKLLVALLFSASASVNAATITAASCNASAVQSAMNQASAGDTVAIPAGTCSWTSTVSWNAPANVTLRGAGNLTVQGGGDATVIVDNYGGGSPILDLNTSSGTFRMAGITFRGGSGAIKEVAMVAVSGGAQIRIDHVHFDMWSYGSAGSNSKMIRFVGDVAGVVDSSIFDIWKQANYLFFQGGHDAPWAAPSNHGGSNFLFVEDNTIRTKESDTNWFHPGFTDCNDGGRFVIRFNSFQTSGVGQTHPTGGAGRGRGCRSHEIYMNTVSSAPTYSPSQDQPPFAFSWISSGTALVWGNNFGTSQFKTFLALNSMRKDNSTYSQSATPNGWGYCGTEFTGTRSNWDGNTNATTGYPCLDQPGRGQGDLISGDFPNAVNTRTGTIAWPNQTLEPVYEWGNTGTTAPGWGDGGLFDNQSKGRLVQNRDYYLYTASFNGTSGVGVGARASRPATCTKGVAYWSTDQGGNWNTKNSSANDGALDVCTATNTWTNGNYVPYVYPHPLTGNDVSGSSAPPPALTAPTNLRITGS